MFAKRRSDEDQLRVVTVRLIRYHALLESLQTVFGIGSNSNLSLGIEATQYVSEPTAVWKGKVDHFICGFRQSYIIAEDSLFGCG